MTFSTVKNTCVLCINKRKPNLYHFRKNNNMDINIIENEQLSLRPMQCELNILTKSDGSALFTQGETVMIASVSGPVEVKLQNMSIEKSTVEVYFRPKSGHPCVNDRLQEQIIRNTCEAALLTVLHPRTAISIQLQEMEDHGGLLACAINASCLALLNSGLSMKFVIGAVHCIVDKNDELLIDPDHRQLKLAKAHFTFVFDSVLKNIVTVHTSGQFKINQYNDALIICREASQLIFSFYRDIVTKFAKII